MNSTARSLRFTALIVFFGLASVAAPRRVAALQLELDYTYDTSFSFPQARAAMEAAAADLGGVITTPLLGVTISPAPVFSATASGGFVALTMINPIFVNPANGLEQSYAGSGIAADTIRVFIGAQAIAGTTVVQSTGRAAFKSVNINATGSNTARNSALAIVVPNANAVIDRGAPFPRATLDLATLSQFPTAPPSVLELGMATGAMWFDNDRNNDSMIDSPSQLEAAWNFDHTQPPPGGTPDMYSFSLTSLLQLLTSSQMPNLVGPNDEWLGPAARALNGGSGFGIIEPGNPLRLRQGTMSPRLAGGQLGRAVLTVGPLGDRRVMLTKMDVAILSDVGWLTVPEPTTFTAAWWAAIALFHAAGVRKAR